MAGLQSGKGRTMIDPVLWAQYINVTDTVGLQALFVTDRQPRRHSKCRANAVYASDGKNDHIRIVVVHVPEQTARYTRRRRTTERL